MVVVPQPNGRHKLLFVPGQRVVSPVPHTWWCPSSHQGHIISPDKRATLSLAVRCQSSHTGHIRATQNLGTTSPVSVLAHGAIRNVAKFSGLAEHPGNQLPDLPLLRLKDEGNSQLVLCAAVPPAIQAISLPVTRNPLIERARADFQTANSCLQLGLNVWWLFTRHQNHELAIAEFWPRLGGI